MNILILEDDVALCRGIGLTLKDDDRVFAFCHDIASARLALKGTAFHLLIIDVNLPDGSGLDFCREIRDRIKAPILFLTANDTELDIISGFETGGDDYMTKPFSLSILRARVNALLRRNTGGNEQITVIDGFSFDFGKMHFSKNGGVVELSKTEQKLLQLLISHRGQTLTRERLTERVWPGGSEYVDENALSVAIRRLRAKLEDKPSAPEYIKTVYGLGYTWAVRE